MQYFAILIFNILILSNIGISLSLSPNHQKPIPEELFNTPLAYKTDESKARDDDVGVKVFKKIRSKTLLEPVIIHHQKNSGGKEGFDEKCQGACITPKACDFHGGKHRGHCISGSICCKFEKSCEGVSREKISFFRSPNYPTKLNESIQCSFEVFPNEQTCALRVEFLELKLAGPVQKTSSVEKCIIDSLYILNTDGGWNEPLCEMENHTAIVFVNKKSAKPVQFLVVAQSEGFKWNLKITQVNCKKIKSWKNEPGCGRQLMYDEGTYLNDSEISMEWKLTSDISSPLIVNGKDAMNREFPWQVSLQNKNGAHRCGASVLNSRFILTAAHCIMRNAFASKNKLKVVIGDYMLNGTDDGEQEDLEIESIIAHYHYEPHKSQLNDIALIKVKTDIKYSERVQPICLPFDSFKTAGMEAWVSGWGRLNASDPKAKATTLQKMKVKVLGDEECKELVMKEVYEVLKRNVTSAEIRIVARMGQSRSQLCAKANLHSAVCFGDSGGPLVIQNEEDGSFTQGQLNPLATPFS